MPMSNYSVRSLQGDITGGLTAAVVALPLALAFGVSSGAGPLAGLYGAILLGFFAAVFGGTAVQVSGPTGPMTVVMAGVLTQFAGADPMLAFAAVVLGGALQVALGLLRVGDAVNYIPLPVISGFMSGIGVIIVLLQLAPLIGHAPQSNPTDALFALPEALRNPHWPTVALAALCLIIVYFTPAKLAKLLPAPLLALVLCTIASLLIGSSGELSRLGAIPQGLPTLQAPTIDLHQLPQLLSAAAVLALLGSIDSLLTSLVADSMTRTRHQSNRELIGQGIGNMVAGMFGGLPGAGATMRTVVNIRAGGTTRASGALHALVLLAVVLGFSGAASQIPHVVLAGILIKVGTDIIDWEFLHRLRTTPKTSIVVMLTVLVMTVFVDLISAVATGLILSSLVLLKRQTDHQLATLRVISSQDALRLPDPAEQQLLEACGNSTLVFQLSGPISFGAAKGVVQQLDQYSAYSDIVFDFSSVASMDFSVIRALEDAVVATEKDGRRAWVCGLQPKLRRKLRNQTGFKQMQKSRFRRRRAQALEAILALNVKA